MRVNRKSSVFLTTVLPCMFYKSEYTETLEAPESTVMIQELDKANKMITKQNDRIEELRQGHYVYAC